jgi:hypothetical protein
VRISDFSQQEPYDPNQPLTFGQQLGLELLPDHEIATPTFVYTLSLRDFQIFVNACRVKNGVKNKRVKFLSDHSHKDVLRGIPASFAHIAFVGVDPRENHRVQTYECSGVWWDIEHLRQTNQFRRAFYYPEWSPGHIIPNIMEGEREW